MTGNLLVTPETLISTAQEFSNMGTQVNTLTQQMIETISSLSGTWAGEAYTAYSGKFNSLNTDMTKIYNMITEHATDLQKMAANYQQAESINVETSAALQVDIIS